MLLVMLAIFSTAKASVAVFVSVEIFVALAVPSVMLPKINVAGAKLGVGSGTTPVPESAMVWVPSASLSLIVKVALLAPAALGAKLTVKVQLAPAARAAGQLLVEG